MPYLFAVLKAFFVLFGFFAICTAVGLYDSTVYAAPAKTKLRQILREVQRSAVMKKVGVQQ